MAEPIAALVEYLTADADVNALVSGRVFGGELPRKENDGMPRAAVIVSPAGPGSIGRAFQRYADIRVDADCYGRTPAEAFSLYEAVQRALKQLSSFTHNETRLKWCRQSAGPSQGRDPDTDWPMVLGSWQVLHTE